MCPENTLITQIFKVPIEQNHINFESEKNFNPVGEPQDTTSHQKLFMDSINKKDYNRSQDLNLFRSIIESKDYSQLNISDALENIL